MHLGQQTVCTQVVPFAFDSQLVTVTDGSKSAMWTHYEQIKQQESELQALQ